MDKLDGDHLAHMFEGRVGVFARQEKSRNLSVSSTLAKADRCSPFSSRGCLDVRSVAGTSIDIIIVIA